MPLKDFDESLMKRLEEPSYAVEYLRAALDDEDPGTFFLALNKLAKVRGGMSKLSADSHLTRAGVYRSLSENGNPSFKTVKKLVASLGMQLTLDAPNT